MMKWFASFLKAWKVDKMGKFYGSDDGYDYSRDNRDGYVDVELRLLEIDRQNRENQKRFEESKNENKKS